MSDMCLKTRYVVFFLFIGGVGVSLGDVSFCESSYRFFTWRVTLYTCLDRTDVSLTESFQTRYYIHHR